MRLQAQPEAVRIGCSSRSGGNAVLHRGAFASIATGLLRADAFVLGSRIFLSPAASDEIGRATPRGRRILAHELEHVRQYSELGIVQFLRLYVTDYLRARLTGAPHGEAYASIRFEREAERVALIPGGPR